MDFFGSIRVLSARSLSARSLSDDGAHAVPMVLSRFQRCWTHQLDELLVRVG